MALPRNELVRCTTVALALVMGTFASSALSKSFRNVSLDTEVKNAETIFSAKVISGTCVKQRCEETSPHLALKQYQLLCSSNIVGKCQAKLATWTRLCIGCDYVFMFRHIKDEIVVFPIEMRGPAADDSQLIYDGTYSPDGVTLRTSERFLNEQHQYFFYGDFIKLVRETRASLRSNPH